MSEYPPSGVLFSNKKKTKETSPDYTGKLELSDEVINDLMDQQSRGSEACPVLSWLEEDRQQDWRDIPFSQGQQV